MDARDQTLRDELVRDWTSIERFSGRVLGRPLRGYQLPVARAILDSVLQGRGLTLAVMMARQSGKNEIAAQVEAFLLNLFRRRGGDLVKAAPTFRPQAANSLARLLAVYGGSHLPPLRRERGYILRADAARALFLSAAPASSVVGATANILLEADEAQDIAEAKWNKDFRPMGASTNVTSVLWGTAWTSQTLLAHTIRALRQMESRDQARRVFVIPWQQVAAQVPAYGLYVRGEIERLGRQHPLIRTQYDLEEIDDEAGMFSAATRVLMRGTHERQRAPSEGREYVLLVDVAGESEGHLEGASLREENPRKDSTAATIVEVARHTPPPITASPVTALPVAALPVAALPVAAPPLSALCALPRFLVMERYYWTGTPHHELYGALVHLAELWGATRLVIDATGVGTGLASFLRQALGERVIPFTFTLASKSDLGWRFLGLCQSGRFLDYRDTGDPLQAQFWREVEAADYQVLPGPGKTMRWGVADPTVHDDLLLSAALCAVLDSDPSGAYAGSQVIEAMDPLA